ncbi:MAG: hypothetical protein KAV87_51965 [Desulfobacteraceae bacterium]|nr:hypothetical protein [Desulfobacteraceae bacterium]
MLKMMKGKVVLLVLPFVFFLNANWAMAQDDRVNGQKGCVVPTVTGNVDKPEGWNSPKIYTSSEEVDLNNFVKVWVDSEGWARPPYSWSVSGTGFHFGSVSGPTTATTNEDLEELELWADDTACGTATITVTDSYNNTETAYIRSSNGVWENCYDLGGSHYCPRCYSYRGSCIVYMDGLHKIIIYCCCSYGASQLGPGQCSDGWQGGVYYNGDYYGKEDEMCIDNYLPTGSCAWFKDYGIYMYTCP